MSRINYAIVSTNSTDDKVNFAAIVKDMPQYEETVFVFEDFKISTDEEGQVVVSSLFSTVVSDLKKRVGEMDEDVIQFMETLATQIVSDTIESEYADKT